MLTAGTATADTPGSSAVVNAFYKWYFSVNGTRAGWSGHLSEAKPYLTASLYALLTKMVAKEKNGGGAILDFDPFVDAQEMATSFKVGTPSGSQVPVTFGFGKSSEHSRVTAIVHSGSTWQIDNFSYGSDGNLRTMLQQQMK